jgi:hypothetical protein
MIVRKAISTFYYALKNYLRNGNFKIISSVYSNPMQSYLAKGIFTK